MNACLLAPDFDSLLSEGLTGAQIPFPSRPLRTWRETNLIPTARMRLGITSLNRPRQALAGPGARRTLPLARGLQAASGPERAETIDLWTFE